MSLKVALYCRVSTQDQVEKFGLPVQRRLLLERAAREQWQHEMYEDPGISGESLARPAMQRLLVDVKAKKVQR